jgi:hypothetical protein
MSTMRSSGLNDSGSGVNVCKGPTLWLGTAASGFDEKADTGPTVSGDAFTVLSRELVSRWGRLSQLPLLQTATANSRSFGCMRRILLEISAAAGKEPLLAL